MSQNLILLGAGATAAIGKDLPTAKDFFYVSEEWKLRRGYYPHLSAACEKVRNSERGKPITLMSVWLFVDTFLKYHLDVRDLSSYNYRLLLERYRSFGKRLPSYLTLKSLNDNYGNLTRDMCPLYSKAPKCIYDTFPRVDPVNYFLVLAGWELKYLLYKTYSPDKKTNDLYKTLLKQLRHESIDISVVNFNWDVFFEKACYDSFPNEAHPVKLDIGDGDPPPKTIPKPIPLCKPHGGWNILHVDKMVLPFPTLRDAIEERVFDRVEQGEIRPAMIPYFGSPDEISEEHGYVFPHVGEYFLNQQRTMRRMLREASSIVSIGYSFSEDDAHVRKAIEEIVKVGSGDKQGRKLLCILKEDDQNQEISRLWRFDGGRTKSLDWWPGGFNEDSVDRIVAFFKEG